MRTDFVHGNRAMAGFTLVELMVTIVVATILVSIAIPTYTSQIRKSRRTEAKSALLDLASREERFYSTNSAYTNDAGNLGYSTATGTSVFQVAVGSGYYQVSVCEAATIPASCGATQPSAGAGAAYLLTAVPVGAQAKDTLCGSFTLDNTGVQSDTGTQTTGCW